MDLKDLKNTWNKISSAKQLDENQLREMLTKRTKSLIERIDRNIRIGFLVLFVLILLFAIDDLLISPKMLRSMSGGVDIPGWLIFVSFFSNALILTTFTYFVIKYFRVKHTCDVACNLRETLKKMINTLLLYQRLFFLALFTFMLNVGLAFISGMYEGGKLQLEDAGAQFGDADTQQLILTVVIGLAVLAIIVGGGFLLLRWGFRKFYGNYITKLRNTLQELDELGEK